MDITILTTASAWGGAELHTLALARALGARDHDVTIAQLGHDLFSRRSADIPDPPRTVVLKRNRQHPNLGYFEALRLLRGLPKDVCIFPKIEFDAGNIRLDLAIKRSFRRYIAIEHTTCPPMPARVTRRHLGVLPGLGLWWQHLRASRVLRSKLPDLTITISDAIRNGLLKHYHYKASSVVAVHNGIDLSRFRPDASLRKRVRAQWGISHEALVFGSVGRLHRLKGHDLSIRLFVQLRHAMPQRDAWLVFVGEGPAARDLASLAHELGVSDRVVFTGFSDKPWEADTAIDIFLLPSAFEGLGLALIEAMACGCCPIATAIGGIPEVVPDRRVGWLVPYGDERAFLEAMKSAATAEDATLANLRKRAREHVQSRFDASVQFPKLIDLIEHGQRSN